MVGGIGALAATVIGGASRADAAAGSALVIGSVANNAGTSNTVLTTNSSVVAFELIQNGPGTALMGYVTPATGATRGVYGRSDSPNGDGVQARNGGAAGSGAGLRAFGGNNDGVVATTTGTTHYAVHGTAPMTGIFGETNTDSGDAVGVYGLTTNGTGVYGDTINGIGVLGTSPILGVKGSSDAGVGVRGVSVTGYAGYFQGKMFATEFFDIQEMSDPPAPAANVARMFVRDSAAKSQLCVRFASGAVQVIATEP
jgi:hypothetical protein